MPGQRVAFDIAKKKEAIIWIRVHGGGVASRAEAHFRAKWWRVTSRRCRTEATARPREGILFDLAIERQSRKEKVAREWIAETAMALFDETGNSVQRFVASDNWVTCFMVRYDLSMRRRTNLTTLTDDVLTDRAVSYMAFLEEHKPDMDPARVVMMDETADFFEDPRLHSVNQRGARHVVMRSTGFASMRVTAMLSVTLSGKKLPPVMTTFERVGGCLVIQQPKAWVDQDLLLRWLDYTFPALYDGPGQVLVWDSMRAHIGKRVKAACVKKEIKMCVVPGGLMPYRQAGDVGIYQSFKDRMSGLITAWKEFTR
ncbi:hypothetical protein PC129_g21262 [Phytophthora cactorum]|uniref:HTH CENPB-type domain-containing protein n=1 Tax=Phytophthora cactorum TaxID=29920 RepID=A0A8T1H6J3_9STRA|nr:hypothetical protein PC129_g21262 [Phytophthora cactorum]